MLDLVGRFPHLQSEVSVDPNTGKKTVYTTSWRARIRVTEWLAELIWSRGPTFFVS